MERVALLTDHNYDTFTIDGNKVRADTVKVGSRFHKPRATEDSWGSPPYYYVDEDNIAKCTVGLIGTLVDRSLAEKVAQPCKRCFK